MAVKSVSMDVFNTKRLAIFFDTFLKMTHYNDKSFGKQLSVDNVNRQENVWIFNWLNKHDRIFDSKVIFSFRNDLVSEQITYNDQDGNYSIVLYADDTINVYLHGDGRRKRFMFQKSLDKANTLLLIRILFQIFLFKAIFKRKFDSKQSIYANKIAELQNLQPNESFWCCCEYANSLWHDLVPLFDEYDWNLTHLLMFEFFEDFSGEESESLSIKKVK